MNRSEAILAAKESRSLGWEAKARCIKGGRGLADRWYVYYTYERINLKKIKKDIKNAF